MCPSITITPARACRLLPHSLSTYPQIRMPLPWGLLHILFFAYHHVMFGVDCPGPLRGRSMVHPFRTFCQGQANCSHVASSDVIAICLVSIVRAPSGADQWMVHPCRTFCHCHFFVVLVPGPPRGQVNGAPIASNDVIAVCLSDVKCPGPLRGRPIVHIVLCLA